MSSIPDFSDKEFYRTTLDCLAFTSSDENAEYKTGQFVDTALVLGYEWGTYLSVRFDSFLNETVLQIERKKNSESFFVQEYERLKVINPSEVHLVRFEYENYGLASSAKEAEDNALLLKTAAERLGFTCFSSKTTTYEGEYGNRGLLTSEEILINALENGKK